MTLIIDATLLEIDGWLNDLGVSLVPEQFTWSVPGALSLWTDYLLGSEVYDINFRLPEEQLGTGLGVAIGRWDEIIANDFTKVSDGVLGRGEIRIAYTSMGTNEDAYSYAGAPSLILSKTGDIWINANNTSGDWSSGSGDFTTLLHELGHILGMVDASDSSSLPAQFDNQRFTVMSKTGETGAVVSFAYEDATFSGTAQSGLVNPVGPMVLDIAAMHQTYGADTTTRSGNDVYSFIERDVSLRSIYDAGGTDTFDLSALSTDNVVDLRPGTYSSIGAADAAAQIAYWTSIYPEQAAYIANYFTGIGDLYEWDHNVGIAQGTLIENAIGGTGNDRITGNALANELTGGMGDDTLLGGGGIDTLNGGFGSDMLNGGAMNDTMMGGDGDDFYVVDNIADLTVEAANEGYDTVFAFTDVTLQDNIEALRMRPGATTGTGNDLDNRMFGVGRAEIFNGEGGSDRIWAQGGDDVLNGGDGDDFLTPGTGKDSMTGGTGRDLFIFEMVSDSAANQTDADVIHDFNPEENDKLFLKPIDADYAADDDQAFSFIGMSAFSGTNGELRYEHAGGNTFVSGDVNGDMVADFMIRLDGLFDMTAGMFAL